MPETAHALQNSENLEAIPSDAETPAKSPEELAREERQIGSKVLMRAGFNDRHKNIVESSFDKLRQQGEKLPGKNVERRNFAYLSRLEQAIDKHGNALEKKLWDASVEKLIVDREAIPESYWKGQEQILRDNGQGRELSEYEKDLLTENLQTQQRDSLKAWANYLGSDDAPYPMWFKVYAWDGMSKMGVFDKDKQEFKRRDDSTVAPYPHLNQAVLGKVYGAVYDFWHQRMEPNDKKLDALVQSGNFNKLYTYFLLNEKVIPRTPERTEDVHGEWIEYLPGQEEELALASEGTPWCVASPIVGKNYLEKGRYINEEYEYTSDDIEDEDHPSKAKFILFHLQDPETGLLADNACASIRLDPDGEVAEISGLGASQALEDALVPIVEEKVKALPGGEDFLEAFADKKRLIELDRKMQAGEKLTQDDLEFIFETKRPIKKLDTYAEFDPRLKELRDIDKLVQAGFEPRYLFQIARSADIGAQLLVFLKHGIKAHELLGRMDPFDVGPAMSELVKAGVKPSELIEEMAPPDVEFSLRELLELGVNANDLVKKMDSFDIGYHLQDLLNAGADVNVIVENLDEESIAHHLEDLWKAGANIETIVKHMGSYGVDSHLSDLIYIGAEADLLMQNLDPYDLARHIPELLKAGANMDQLMDRMDPYDIAAHVEELRQAGVDEKKLQEYTDWYEDPEILDE